MNGRINNQSWLSKANIYCLLLFLFTFIFYIAFFSQIMGYKNGVAFFEIGTAPDFTWYLGMINQIKIHFPPYYPELSNTMAYFPWFFLIPEAFLGLFNQDIFANLNLINALFAAIFSIVFFQLIYKFFNNREVALFATVLLLFFSQLGFELWFRSFSHAPISIGICLFLLIFLKYNRLWYSAALASCLMFLHPTDCTIFFVISGFLSSFEEGI